MARPPKATTSAPETVAKTPAQRAKELSALAMQTLEGILRGESGDTAKIAAAREVLDRFHGKTKPPEKAPASKALTVVIRRFSDDTNVIPLKKDKR